MIRHSTLFLVIAIITLVMAFGNLFLNVATSVIPGWHTTYYPPFYWVSLTQVIWICLLPVFYFIAEKKNRTISHRSFLMHLGATLTFFIPMADLAHYPGAVNYLSVRLMIILWLVIFTLGQLWFLISVLKSNRRRIKN